MVNTKQIEELFEQKLLHKFKTIIREEDTNFPILLIAGGNIFHDHERKNVLLQVSLDSPYYTIVLLPPNSLKPQPLWKLIDRGAQNALFGDIYVYDWENFILSLAEEINKERKPQLTFSLAKSIAPSLTRLELDVFARLYGMQVHAINCGYPLCTEKIYYYAPADEGYIMIETVLGYSDTKGRTYVYIAPSIENDP